jgi:hypothetical protein
MAVFSKMLYLADVCNKWEEFLGIHKDIIDLRFPCTAK